MIRVFVRLAKNNENEIYIEADNKLRTSDPVIAHMCILLKKQEEIVKVMDVKSYYEREA